MITGCCFRLQFEHIEGRLYSSVGGGSVYTTLDLLSTPMLMGDEPVRILSVHAMVLQ